MLQHPLSAAFPAMGEREFKELVTDLENNGQRQPCVVLDGMVLDGWHRYRACMELGVKPMTLDFAGGDPRAFVLSLNLQRRHLTASQRAAAVVAVVAWRPTGVSRSAPGAEHPPTSENMAAEAGVSVRTVNHAKVAHRRGLGEAVRDGKVSAKAAAAPPKALSEPPEEPEAESNGARIEDMLVEFEAMVRVIAADDKLEAAWLEAKELAAKLEAMTAMYDGKCRELAEMTKEAKRWKRKAESK
jgi:hypothetical protein